eukprot:248965_1
MKSNGSLYEIFVVDSFKSSVKIKNISQFYDIDNIMKINGIEIENKLAIPPLLIISLMLPGSDNIDGLQIVYFAKICDQTVQNILNDKQTESIQLFQNFIENINSNNSEIVNHWRKKFKVTANK